ncbi:MAG: peptide chain release factor N(5)-glutamine methyltransferase [Myxococcales bacterium]
MSSRTWTIRELLQWATEDFSSRGVESPRLDAELLVAHALRLDRVGLYLDLNRPLLEEERAAIRPLVARRRGREPVAYILGHKDFYGRRFSVTPQVLIPRPDTETLVEHALDCIPIDAPCNVLDVGTGSGAIAITIAAERPLARVHATDKSASALAVAAGNAEAHGVATRVRFEHTDLVAAGARYDVIVSNPPYVSSGELATLQAEVRSYEPTMALDGGQDGLDVVRALLRAAESVTQAGAQLLVEVGLGQAAEVMRLAASKAAWREVTVYRDLNRVDRVVHLCRI